MKAAATLILFFIVVMVFISCDKAEQGFNAQGGQLPTHYIVIKDSSFSPATLSVVSGSSISFLNQTNNQHTIVSDDSLFIKSTAVSANSSFIIKPNYFGTVSYHCVNHPTARGALIITP